MDISDEQKIMNIYMWDCIISIFWPLEVRNNLET